MRTTARGPQPPPSVAPLVVVPCLGLCACPVHAPLTTTLPADPPPSCCHRRRRSCRDTRYQRSLCDCCRGRCGQRSARSACASPPPPLSRAGVCAVGNRASVLQQCPACARLARTVRLHCKVVWWCLQVVLANHVGASPLTLAPSSRPSRFQARAEEEQRTQVKAALRVSVLAARREAAERSRRSAVEHASRQRERALVEKAALEQRETDESQRSLLNELQARLAEWQVALPLACPKRLSLRPGIWPRFQAPSPHQLPLVLQNSTSNRPHRCSPCACTQAFGGSSTPAQIGSLHTAARATRACSAHRLQAAVAVWAMAAAAMGEMERVRAQSFREHSDLSARHKQLATALLDSESRRKEAENYGAAGVQRTLLRQYAAAQSVFLAAASQRLDLAMAMARWSRNAGSLIYAVAEASHVDACGRLSRRFGALAFSAACGRGAAARFYSLLAAVDRWRALVLAARHIEDVETLRHLLSHSEHMLCEASVAHGEEMRRARDLQTRQRDADRRSDTARRAERARLEADQREIAQANNALSMAEQALAEQRGQAAAAKAALKGAQERLTKEKNAQTRAASQHQRAALLRCIRAERVASLMGFVSDWRAVTTAELVKRKYYGEALGGVDHGFGTAGRPVDGTTGSHEFGWLAGGLAFDQPRPYGASLCTDSLGVSHVGSNAVAASGGGELDVNFVSQDTSGTADDSYGAHADSVQPWEDPASMAATASGAGRGGVPLKRPPRNSGTSATVSADNSEVGSLKRRFGRRVGAVACAVRSEQSATMLCVARCYLHWRELVATEGFAQAAREHIANVAKLMRAAAAGGQRTHAAARASAIRCSIRSLMALEMMCALGAWREAAAALQLDRLALAHSVASSAASAATSEAARLAAELQHAKGAMAARPSHLTHELTAEREAALAAEEGRKAAEAKLNAISKSHAALGAQVCVCNVPLE